MSPVRIAFAALAVMLLVTGCRTRPVEIAQERFERSKAPIVAVVALRA